jgi:hypothetical protein
MSADLFKDDPLQFMREHVILPDLVEDQATNPGQSDVRRFTLVEAETFQVTNREGAKVYRLIDVPDDDEPDDYLSAYWCPYRANHQLGAMLEQDAVYMFTAVMDGCSFGIGSATPDGSRAVFHANSAAVGDQARGTDPTRQKKVQKGLKAQTKHQAKLLSHMRIEGGNVIDPNFYGGGLEQTSGAYTVKYKSTTVGLRTARGWTFYTLKYRRASRSIEHHGLAPFVPMV